MGGNGPVPELPPVAGAGEHVPRPLSADEKAKKEAEIARIKQEAGVHWAVWQWDVPRV